MKNALLKLSVLIISLSALIVSICHGQSTQKHDIIILRDKTKLEVTIREQINDVIKYKKVTDPDGPIFSIKHSEIASIYYANGQAQHFTDNSPIYDEIVTSPVAPYMVKPRWYNLPLQTVRQWNPDQLRTNYRFYLKKANAYKNMGAIGAFGGVIMLGAGVILMSTEDDPSYYGVYSGTTDKQAAGAMLFVVGLGAGIPLTIIGFAKKKSYGKKAVIVKDELIRRREPLSFNFRPAFNLATQSAGLSVRMSF